MDHSQFWKETNEKHDPKYPSSGWIQWKGTQVCIDLHCVCGYHGHMDTDFFYFYECPDCHRKFVVMPTVKLHELNKEQIAYVEGRKGAGFQTCELEVEND